MLNDPISNRKSVFEPQRWGLPLHAIAHLGERLHSFWQRHAAGFKTKTRDTSSYGLAYFSAQLRLPCGRHFAGIARSAQLSTQNMQHFMSNSPWDGRAVIAGVQQELIATPQLAGGMLLLDESADKKSGTHSAGAGRQWNGRLGKVDLSQVGVFLAYAQGHSWSWVDGELFLPEGWFAADKAGLRQQLGIPAEREFATKVELGWQMLKRSKAAGLPFVAVGCDELYGRSNWLRSQMNRQDIVYMADVPNDFGVYLQQPLVGVPAPKPGRHGKAPSKPRVLEESKPLGVREVAQLADTAFVRLTVRNTERGRLVAEFAARRVWTERDGLWSGTEWLLIRREQSGEYSYSLSNAPSDCALEQLAFYKSQRCFVERANQDAKSELGWDELAAQKYRAWEHHLALTILASWFIVQTKLEWAERHERDPQLTAEMEVDILPALSMANVRAMLRAALPLPQLTPEQAADLVVEHLVNRTRSRKSRLKRQHLKPLS